MKPTIMLDKTLSQQIRQLCQQGYERYDQGDYKAALRAFYRAWTQLPKPQTDYLEAGWVLAALGDTYFIKGDYPLGEEALRSALHCPDTNGNPFVHLRLGQCLYELDQQTQAKQQFCLALHHGGESLLSKTEQKYQQCAADCTA